MVSPNKKLTNINKVFHISILVRSFFESCLSVRVLHIRTEKAQIRGMNLKNM